MSENGSVIRIPQGATLTIRDTSGTNARIAGGYAPQGGCIYNAGKLYFESGRIGADNTVNANIANDGAAVYNTGTMVMSGGLIDHNKTLQYGGGRSQTTARSPSPAARSAAIRPSSTAAASGAAGR